MQEGRNVTPPIGIARVLAQPVVARLARSLGDRVPVEIADEEGMRRAAVALILHLGEANEPELLMIKRAVYDGDPWSGHIALPGGRREPGDLSLEETAIRETREETAIDLARDGRVIGRLDDVLPLSAPLPSIAIAPFVSVHGALSELRLSCEVAEAFWVPISALRDPRASREVVLDLTGGPRRTPSFQHRGHIIWGLTERILRQFLDLLE